MLWSDLSRTSVFVYQGGAPCLIGHNVGIISAGDQWPGHPGPRGYQCPAPGYGHHRPGLWPGVGGAGRGDTCHVTRQASDNTEMDEERRGCECGQDNRGLLLIGTSQKDEKRIIPLREIVNVCVEWSDVLVSWVFWLFGVVLMMGLWTIYNTGTMLLWPW